MGLAARRRTSTRSTLVPIYYADGAGSRIGPRVPHAVRYSGSRYRLDVTFVASGLHARLGHDALGALAADDHEVIAKQRRRAAEEARRDDD